MTPLRSAVKRIALRDLDARGIDAGEIMIAVGRIPAHARAGRGQQPQFRTREIASADQLAGIARLKCNASGV